jgi:tetratricopeptide (TPR) repeat protein
MLLVYKMGIRSGDKKAQAHAMNNLGIITQNMGDTTASLNYYKSFLALASDMKDKKEISLAYNNLGSLYYEQNDLTKAEDYFTKAFLLVKEIDNLSSMSHYTRNLSDVYLKKSDIQKGIDYAFTAYQWADSCESLKEKVQALKNLSDGYERLNNSHQSLLYLKDYLTYNDSLKNSENTSSLQDLKIKFETEQKEQTIKLLEKEMEIKESRLIFIIIFAILVVFVFIIIIRLKNLKVKASQSEKALAEAHLKNAQFETDSLKKELEFKNKELSLAAINLVQKHEFIESISLQLQDSVKQNNDDQKTKIQKQLSFSQNLEKERNPNLSENDKKLCALLRLNLSSKEISVILNISPASVDMSRHRLRKKLALEQGDSLLDIFTSL